jgi:hypothetical protein
MLILDILPDALMLSYAGYPKIRNLKVWAGGYQPQYHLSLVILKRNILC